MKPILLLPPVLALLIVGSWAGLQRWSMGTLETENVRLRNAIASAKPQASIDPAAHDLLGKSRKVIEWTNLAKQFQPNPWMSGGSLVGALPDPREAARFRQRMEMMNPSDVIAALDEITALALPASAQEGLTWTLLDSLARKDPSLALDRIAERGGTSAYLYSQLITDTLAAWVRTDSVAAEAWLDSQIAAGAFESKTLDRKSGFRQNYESALISVLLSSAPAAAARRLAALPGDQRGDVMHMYAMSNVPEATQVAHAALVRALVPLKDQAETIASQTSSLFKPGDYTAVTAYLDRIAASPAERAASAMTAILNLRPTDPNSDQFTRDDFDQLRQWTRSQAPEAMDEITGKALGNAAQGNMKFAAAAELAAHYSAEGGSDEVLATFLTSGAASRNKPLARTLTEGISDEVRRAEVLKFLK